MEIAEYIQQMQPELADDPGAMEFYITLAKEVYSANFFGSLANFAYALYAMHNYVIDRDRPSGEAGLVTARSEGNASIRYYNKIEKGRYSDLQMTHYGQRLLKIIKSRSPSVSVAGDPSRVISRIVSSLE